MLGMKNHFDISDSIEIREVDIAEVACIFTFLSDIYVLIVNEQQLESQILGKPISQNKFLLISHIPKLIYFQSP